MAAGNLVIFVPHKKKNIVGQLKRKCDLTVLSVCVPYPLSVSESFNSNVSVARGGFTYTGSVTCMLVDQKGF